MQVEWDWGRVAQTFQWQLAGSLTGKVLVGIALLCLVGIIAGVRASSWLRQPHETRERQMVLPRLIGIVLLCDLGDWTLLRALPWLRLSFSTQIALPLIVAALVRLALLWGWAIAALILRWWQRRHGTPARDRPLVLAFLVVNLSFSAIQAYAYVAEPLLVETTELSLAFEDLSSAAPPVRVVHLTDIHIERNSYREATVIRRVNALQPDLIVLTGDYLNLSRLHDPVSAAHFRELVGQLRAPYGIYAVRGSVEPTIDSMAWLAEGTDLVWLEQEAVTVDVRGQSVTLLGVACSHQEPLDARRLAQTAQGVPADAFTLLLYHSPDLIREAAAGQIDLYLGGHTHGGQLRLPILGPIYTGSKYGSKYASGLFQEGSTRMVISRGIGMEGSNMPRARFLCRPEIVSIELKGTGD